MDSFICWVCEEPYPQEFRNMHHKVPKSLGGKDTSDNLLALCAGCHQFLHALARMMRNPKRVGDVRSALQSAFPRGDVQGRCLELANLECRSKVMNREKVQADTNREIAVGLKLKKPYRDALQLLARDRGFSMADYVRKLIESHIVTKYPNVEKM